MADESTRRLPNWMLGVSATADDDRKKKKKKKNRHGDDTTEPEEEEEEDKTNLATNSKFEGKRRKGNQDTDNKELNVDSDNVINQKTSNRLGRKRKAKSKAEIEAEEEAELTVEDLVSIAEEYVKADEESRRIQASSRECKLQRQLLTTASSNNDLEDSLIVPDDKHISASCETTASYSSSMNLVGEQSLISTCGAGDPAHDMLDLFLGPLLKKPMEKEKRDEFIAKDIDFTYDLKKKSQNDVGDEMVPPMMKKKSSLKDKVSSLLD